MALFEILAGLPAYGSTAKSFPISGYGAFREGFVVQFESKMLGKWVGNFQLGQTSFSGAFEHPDRKHVVIVSGGDVYIVDPETKSTDEFGGAVVSVMQINESNALLFNEGTNLSLISANTYWRTKRLSWDGICDLSTYGGSVSGKGWRYDDTWHTFSVSLANGTHTGGAYDESAFLPTKRSWWQFWRSHS